MNELPEFPPIEDDELRRAISALANAARMLRGVFIQLAEGKPLEEIVSERGDYLLLAERVIDGWCEHLGIDDGHEFNGSDGG